MIAYSVTILLQNRFNDPMKYPYTQHITGNFKVAVIQCSLPEKNIRCDSSRCENRQKYVVYFCELDLTRFCKLFIQWMSLFLPFPVGHAPFHILRTNKENNILQLYLLNIQPWKFYNTEVGVDLSCKIRSDKKELDHKSDHDLEIHSKKAT